jgi:hypothetical protein
MKQPFPETWLTDTWSLEEVVSLWAVDLKRPEALVKETAARAFHWG